MEEQHAWDRMEQEPSIWYRRFERFRLMEPSRSIAAVFQQEDAEKNREKPRTKPTGDWYEVAKQWRWEERAEAWDAYQASIEEKQIAQEKAKVLRRNYALMHKRVAILDEKVRQLLAMTEDEGKVWVPDVKSVGTGPTAERVDLVQFNADLYREIREYLTDLAEETGGRVKKTETAITSLPKIYTGIEPTDDGSED